MARPFMTAEWVNLGIVTYSVPPRLLASRVPAGLELDICAGQAFVSLVAFNFRDTRVLGVPWPGYRDFPELNLRYYVRRGPERGVVFLREFVGLHLVSWIARNVYNENYRVAPIFSATHETPDLLTIELRLRHSRRTHFVVLTGQKPALLPADTSMEHLFTELRWGFGINRQGLTVQYEVQHPVWKIYPVRSYCVELDWGNVFGPQWKFLNQQTPCSTVLAAGSEVPVFPRAERNGRRATGTLIHGRGGSFSFNGSHPLLNGSAPKTGGQPHESRSDRPAQRALAEL